MKRSINPSVTNQSLVWLKMQSPNVPSYWARTSRLLNGVPQSEREEFLNRLKSGQPIVYESSGVCIQQQSLSMPERKRLNHLLSFEVDSYRLDTFRLDSALYYHNGQIYYSMSEMAERGYLPLPAITLNPGNEAITTAGGRLLDVFVPLNTAKLNFTYHAC